MSSLPQVLNCDLLTENSIRLTLEINSDADVFKGHFPGCPILAGIVQIDWASRFANQYLHCKGRFSGMDRIRFHRIIQPPAQICLMLIWRPEQGRLDYSYRMEANGYEYSSGCLHIA